MQIFVKLSSGEKYDLQVDATATVAELKGSLAALANLPAEQQRLVYKGRVLQDSKTLGEYGLEEGHVVHAVRSRHVRRSRSSTSHARRSRSVAQPQRRRAPLALWHPLCVPACVRFARRFARARRDNPCATLGTARDAATLAQRG
jgi:ubiquilin